MPLLKKSSLHANNMTNYCPVSNLLVMGKLLVIYIDREIAADYSAHKPADADIFSGTR